MWDWKVKTAKQKEKHDWVEYEPTYGDDEDEELHVDDGNWKTKNLKIEMELNEVVWKMSTEDIGICWSNLWDSFSIFFSSAWPKIKYLE